MKGQISCVGKRGYLGFLTARRMAERTNDDRDTAVQPYRCRFCLLWHLGTHAPKMKRPVAVDQVED